MKNNIMLYGLILMLLILLFFYLYYLYYLYNRHTSNITETMINNSIPEQKTTTMPKTKTINNINNIKTLNSPNNNAFKTIRDIKQNITETMSNNSTPDDIMTGRPKVISSPLTMPPAKDTKCYFGDNVVDYCINYDNCCKNNDNDKNCYCNHSFVKNCKTIYDECINTQTPETCAQTLKECCIKYNNINIEYDNFKKPIIQEQRSNTICNLNFIKNIDTKCMELCQTNNECKAYSTTAGINCVLYDNILPIPTKIGAKASKESTKYYIKK